MEFEVDVWRVVAALEEDGVDSAECWDAYMDVMALGRRMREDV